MPIAHDDARITPKCSMRPITAAARARSRICGPNAEPSGSPSMPARRIMAIVAMRVAIIHASVVHATDVHAQQRGPVGAARARAHGDPHVRVAQEREQQAGHRERRDHRHQLTGVEDERLDVEAEVEREGQELRRERGVEEAGDRFPDAGEQLGETDRGDHEDQARRACEPADHEELDRGTEHDGDDQRQRHRDPVRPAAQHDERDAQARGDGAEVGLREVDHAVRPVDEHEPEREQRGQRADHEAPHHDADRRRPDELERAVERGDARGPTGQQPDLAEVRHAPLMPGEASHIHRERPTMKTDSPQ